MQIPGTSVLVRAALALGVWCTPATASAAQYWLGGIDPVGQANKHFGPADYMDLFGPDAPWTRGAARLSVFKLSAQSILRGSDDMLRTIFGDMRRRHVAMAVEIGAVLRTAECGGGEGYAPPDLMDRVGGKLQRLGLSLDYMAMDEPVWFGHVHSWGRRDCTYPIPELTDRVARSVGEMRRFFPNIRVGDIEVVAPDREPPAQLVAEYAQFARLFQQRTGTPLAFLHADIAWRTEWRPLLAMIARQMHEMGIRFGVIAGGSPDDGTDEVWMRTAVARVDELAGTPALRPDDVIVQSWIALPTRMLPEAGASATGLLLHAETVLR